VENKLVIACHAVHQSAQKRPALRGFPGASATRGRSGYPTSEAHNSYWTTAIYKMIAQKNGKSKLLVWKVGAGALFAKILSDRGYA
jgi:hypothetical protein